MKTIAVIANCGKPRAADMLKRLVRKAGELGMGVRADAEAARLCGAEGEVQMMESWDGISALVALGGDGTMLRAVRDLNGRDIPVLGVNIGGLGFLTSVAEQDLERAMECLAREECAVSARSVAECRARRGADALEYRALNDVVITHALSPRVATLDLALDGEEVSSLICDGLIVSTPTGSTGHSLSAGGPIVLPGARVLVVSSICAHTLSTRPLVVPDDSVLRVRVAACSGELALSVDGQVGSTLGRGDWVEVRRSRHSVRFLHLPGHSYFSILRQKLHWRGSNV